MSIELKSKSVRAEWGRFLRSKDGLGILGGAVTGVSGGIELANIINGLFAKPEYKPIPEDYLPFAVTFILGLATMAISFDIFKRPKQLKLPIKK